MSRRRPPLCPDCRCRLESTLDDDGRWLACPRCEYRMLHRTIPEWIAEARSHLTEATP